MKKPIIPVFYAADENYMPYLAVALAALKEYKSKGYEYRIHVLYSGVLNGAATKVKRMEEEDFYIFFEDVGEKIDTFNDCIHCRDYYTSAIYYRLLIPELFPQYDKVLYMDCDTVAISDIANLYNIDIGDNYIGAVADQAVAAVPQFRAYVKNALGIDAEKYFNSGVIVMNLAKLREVGFYGLFSKVLRSYAFTIAPDQDVLNLICKDKVYYYEAGWNKMPIGGREGTPKLIHYNLCMKPWRYDGVLFEEYFWDFAARTPFLEYMMPLVRWSE
ncbi:MAG: glycosyltransferase family 8 protein [Clostridia bacterium]|nr:glycosyltransferase family 8 protein [Clostridia bacterium]